ncbi:MAG TPA: thaumatin family protein [Trebonia sp.]|nr:thaumatin family protein [Trebonia sp.]
MRLGVRQGRGKRGSARRQFWQARAFALTAALAAVIFTAGCAALGTSTASGPGPVTATAAAGSKSSAQAAAPTTQRASAAPRTAAPTLARMPTSTPATGTHPAQAATGASPHTAPAASEPPTSGAAGQPSGDRRLVTFVNDMAQTIWVAAAPNANTPLAATGWVLPAGQSVTITTPNNLNTRFWGRTGCSFNSAGAGHCETGDCGGQFQCKGWGTIPATLAEVNFDAWDNLDFYDVSMVDGANLPMFINITKSSGGTKDKISQNGCVAAGCTKPVNCPSALAVKAGSAVVGCISACARLGGDQYCCQGPYSSRAACNPTTWPVDYAAVFKSAEPYAYSYVDDDATSVFTCSGVCDYRITFGISH